MVVTFQNPTAEEILAALREVRVPDAEIARLSSLVPTTGSGENTRWSEEDLRDLDRYTAHLIDERFGPEEGNYD